MWLKTLDLSFKTLCLRPKTLHLTAFITTVEKSSQTHSENMILVQLKIGERQAFCGGLIVFRNDITYGGDHALCQDNQKGESSETSFFRELSPLMDYIKNFSFLSFP